MEKTTTAGPITVNGKSVAELISTSMTPSRGTTTDNGNITIDRQKISKVQWLFQDLAPNRKAVRAIKAWNRSNRKLTAAQHNHARRPPGTAHYFQ